MLTDICMLAVALVLCVAVVRIAYTSIPEDGLEFEFMLDVPRIRARWARRWRRLVARVAAVLVARCWWPVRGLYDRWVCGLTPPPF